MTYRVRPARRDDLPRLAAIERSAQALFARVGMPELLDWARAAGYPAATLSTFRDVPWNAPFYARCGFREVPLSEASPELLELRRLEGTYGLPSERRVVMRLVFGLLG